MGHKHSKQSVSAQEPKAFLVSENTQGKNKNVPLNPQTQYDKYQISSLRTNKSKTLQRIDLMDFERVILGRITMFLSIEDIIRLQCTNLRLLSLISRSNSCLAWNFIINNFNLNIAFDDKTRELTISSLKSLCYYTEQDWIALFIETTRIRKNWLNTDHKVIFQKLYRSNLQLPELVSEIKQVPTNNFQKRALREEVFQKTGSVPEAYKYIFFELKNIQVDRIEHAYTQIQEDQECPILLKNAIQVFMQIVHMCKFFAAVLFDGIQLEDPVEFLNLFSMCWLQLSNGALEIDEMLTSAISFINQNCENNQINLTDVIINIWRWVVFRNEINEHFYNCFMKVLTNNRKERAQSLQNQDISQSHQIQVLIRCVKMLVDISCTQKNVKLLGHPNFKFAPQLQDILSETLFLTSKNQDFYLQKFQDDFGTLSEFVEQDLQFLKSILGDWVTEHSIEPQHLEILKQVLQGLVLPKVCTISQSTSDELIKSFIIFSTESEELLTQEAFIENQIQVGINNQGQMLEIMLNIHVNSQKLDQSNDLLASNSSLASTGDSSVFSDIMVHQKDVQMNPTELAIKIRESYPYIAAFENYILRRTVILENSIRDRQALIEQSDHMPCEMENKFVTIGHANFETNVAKTVMKLAHQYIH